MFRKIKARAAAATITALTAVTGACALGMGSAAPSTQAAAVKTASITDVMSQLKAQTQTVVIPTYNFINAWPTKTSGPNPA